MKTYVSLKMAVVMAMTLFYSSCQTEEFNDPAVQLVEEDAIEEGTDLNSNLRTLNSSLFPLSAKPYGKSTEEWTIEFARVLMALNCEEVNTNQLLRLGENVVAPSGSLSESENYYTLSKNDVVLFSPAFILNDYPCPDADFEPAPGQTLEEFLKEGAKSILDDVENLVVFYDGAEIVNINDYRLSTDLFYFTGNPELAECFDPCVTGEPQPGVVDGYFFMMKKMKVGEHTVQIKGEIPEIDFIFDLTVHFIVEK